nr:MAG TPA: hypothetical protein [Bacteriophage sp.]
MHRLRYFHIGNYLNFLYIIVILVYTIFTRL